LGHSVASCSHATGVTQRDVAGARPRGSRAHDAGIHTDGYRVWSGPRASCGRWQP
jgi:hypothetical protein